MKRRTVQKLQRKVVRGLQHKNAPLVMSALAFSLLGTILLFRSFAAGPWESLQPESGAQSGNVSVVADAGSSGGSYVQFGGSSGTYTRLEAENATHNVQVVNLTGTSGNKVLGYFYQQGNYVTFAVNAPSAGSYAARIRYNAALNETGQPGTMVRSLLINNQSAGTPSFPLTTNTLNNWSDPSTYQTRDLGSLSLNAGNNTITLRIDDSASGYPWDVDFLEISGVTGGVNPPTPPPPPPPGPNPPPPPPPSGGGYATRKCTADNIPGSPVYLNGGDLRSALSALQSGQTLVVGPGTYTADVDMGSKSNVTICANPSGGRPLIYGGIGFNNASNVHIEGFEFNGNGTSIGGITYSWGSTNMSAWDNWVHNYDQCGICSAAAGGKIDFRYNRIWDNSHTSCFGGSGISLWAFSNSQPGNNSDGYNSYIIGNMLWDNYQSVPSTCIGAGEITDGNCIIIDAMNGSQGGLGGSTDQFAGRFLIANNTCANNGGRCINIFASQRADVFNNTCYRNATSPQPSGNNEIGIVFADDVRVRNNVVIAGIGLVHGQYQSSNIEISNNIWFGNGASVFGANDRVIDPQLTNPQLNPTQGDWRPRAGSPALNSGTFISVVTIDAAGKNRPNPPSLGAWEL